MESPMYMTGERASESLHLFQQTQPFPMKVKSMQEPRPNQWEPLKEGKN